MSAPEVASKKQLRMDRRLTQAYLASMQHKRREVEERLKRLLRLLDDVLKAYEQRLDEINDALVRK